MLKDVFFTAGLSAVMIVFSSNAYAESFGNWKVVVSQDSMTDENKGIMKSINNSGDGYIGLACGKGRMSIMIRKDGTFSAPRKDAQLTFRVDGAKAIKLIGRTVGFKSAFADASNKDLMSAMSAGSLLKFRAYAPGGGGGLMDGGTSLNGFGNAYKRLKSHCNGL